MNIETTMGTMTAEPWHVGKMVTLNPSGFNWRVEDDDVDTLIYALENKSNSTFIGYRSQIIVQHVANAVEVIASDTASYRYPVCKAHITDNGVQSLLQVLKSVQNRPTIAALLEALLEARNKKR